jgi:LysM repeat protein
MGLFSFISSAGAKLFGGKKLSEIPNIQELIHKHLQSVGLDVKHVHYFVTGDVLEVCGWVPSKELKEKLVVAVGNVEGVDKIEDRLVVGKPPEVLQKKAEAPAPAAEIVKVSAPAGAFNVEKMIVDSIGVLLPTKAEAEAHAVESRFYTVVKGDTLSKIAKAMYGDAMKYPLIFEANKPMLKDPDLIYPGQTLRIPNLDGDPKTKHA